MVVAVGSSQHRVVSYLVDRRDRWRLKVLRVLSPFRSFLADRLMTLIVGVICVSGALMSLGASISTVVIAAGWAA